MTANHMMIMMATYLMVPMDNMQLVNVTKIKANMTVIADMMTMIAMMAMMMAMTTIH